MVRKTVKLTVHTSKRSLMYTGNGITHVYMYASTQEKFYLLFSLILHAQQNHYFVKMVFSQKDFYFSTCGKTTIHK